MLNLLKKSLLIALLYFCVIATNCHAQDAVDEMLFEVNDMLKEISKESPTETRVNSEEILPDIADVSELESEDFDNKSTKNTFNSLPFKGSYINSDEENDQIYDAIRIAIERQKSLTIGPTTASPLLDQQQNITNSVVESIDEENTLTTDVPIDAPSYTLNSILFYDEKSWSIWLNGDRIRVKQKVPNLIVDEINSRYVVIITQNTEFDSNSIDFQNDFIPYETDQFDESILQKRQGGSLSSLTPNQKQRLIKQRTTAFRTGQHNWQYQSKDGNVHIDSGNGIFKFRIGVNQTFNTAKLQMLEGKLTEENTNTEEPTNTEPLDAIEDIAEEVLEFDF